MYIIIWQTLYLLHGREGFAENERTIFYPAIVLTRQIGKKQNHEMYYADVIGNLYRLFPQQRKQQM
jgi:hypothetical protein